LAAALGQKGCKLLLAALERRFEAIFTTTTGFASLDRLLARLHANKAELLLALERPEVPLHTNGSENDIRCQVTKRKISGGTRSHAGRDCRDAFLGPIKTCAKNRISLCNLRERKYRQNKPNRQASEIYRQEQLQSALPTPRASRHRDDFLVAGNGQEEMLKHEVQAADDQPPEPKAKADPQEECLMGRPSVFVCSYLLANVIISAEHSGGNPKYGLGAHPVHADVKNGAISDPSYRTASIIDQ
jgi:hypothetical protein